jgi:ankyrin repeat protein
MAFQFVEQLIPLYPEALVQPDEIGFVPLHYAVLNRNPSETVVNAILFFNEASAFVADKLNGHIALEHACMSDCFSELIVRALVETNPESAQRGLDAAQSVGHINVFFMLKQLFNAMQREMAAQTKAEEAKHAADEAGFGGEAVSDSGGFQLADSVISPMSEKQLLKGGTRRSPPLKPRVAFKEDGEVPVP